MPSVWRPLTGESVGQPAGARRSPTDMLYTAGHMGYHMGRRPAPAIMVRPADHILGYRIQECSPYLPYVTCLTRVTTI